jgi:hypothetical protein
MTTKQIEASMHAGITRVTIVHETALAIRTLLDKAEKEYNKDGKQDYTDDDVANTIIELATGEDE